jgi:hypothetical protein
MLHVEIRMQGRVITLPTLRPGDPPASLTDHRPAGAQLLLIACNSDDQGATLSVSQAGLSVEHGTWRLVHSVDLVFERALGAGEVYQRPLQTRRGRVLLRLRHVPGPG